MLKYLSGINNNKNMRNTRMQQARRLQILNRSYGVYPTTMEELNGIGKAKGKAKAKVQAKVQKAKAVVKKVAQSKVIKQVAKVGLAPARGAFLALVRVNGLGLAKKLILAYKKSPKMIDDFWQKLSGKPEELRKVVEQGSKQKIAGLGAALETLIATATPIVVKITATLQKLGIKDPKALLQKGAKFGMKKLAERKQKGVSIEEKEVPESQAEETQVSVEKTMPVPSEVPTTEETATNSRTAKPIEIETTATSGKNKMLIPLLIAGGVGAFFLLGRKK
jgi:hypothetical protein